MKQTTHKKQLIPETVRDDIFSSFQTLNPQVNRVDVSYFEGLFEGLSRDQDSSTFWS